jgi:methionyl-tRNA formyltransferase
MRIGILGRSEFLLNSAKLLYESGHEIMWVVTAPAESYYLATESDFEKLSEVIGCPFFIESNLEQAKILKFFEASNTEVVISVNWPRVIGSAICNAFPMGIFNAHLGDLPKYRGNACPNWAIINGEKRIGLCIHQMLPGSLDSGPIYGRDFFELQQDSYISEVYEWGREKIPSLFLNLMHDIQNLAFVPEYQSDDPEHWLRCYPRRPSDSQIRWNEDSESIQRLVRASSKPFSGAYTYFEGKYRINIWKAKVFKHKGRFQAIPGQLLFMSNGNLVVACGTDALEIEEYEIPSDINEVKLNRMRSRFIYVADRSPF